MIGDIREDRNQVFSLPVGCKELLVELILHWC